MRKTGQDVGVGLFVLIGAAAVLFLALRAGNLLTFSFARTYPVYANFDNIGGLKARAAVKSAGVVVGRIESIGFDDKTFQAKVTMQLQNGYVFPKDSSAKILTSGLLGEQYLGIEPGGDPANLAAGDTIHQTYSAIVLENLISQFIFNKAAEGAPAGAGAASAPVAPGVKK